MTVPLIPRSVFLSDPERISPKVSPDGRLLSYLAPADGIVNLWAGSVGGEDVKPVTHETRRGIPVHSAVSPDYTWAYDSQHLLFSLDSDGDENWRLYAVDVTTHDVRELTPFAGARSSLLGLDPTQPTMALVGINTRDPRFVDAYLLDITTGELTLVLENSEFASLYADGHLRIRAAMRARADGGLDFVVRHGDEDWLPLLSVGVEDARGVEIVGFTEDGAALVITPEGTETAQLVRLDLASGIRTVLASDPRYDVTSVSLDHRTHEPRHATILGTRAMSVPLDLTWAADLATLASFEAGDVTVISTDLADQRWIVAFLRDVGSPVYFDFNRLTKKATRLFSQRPLLDAQPLVPMEPFSFTARDGLLIEGYLSFPRGERTNLPTLLYVHGGPWARDVWGVNPTAQLFANRGYLVVNVNFRGSTGFGKTHLNAGNKEWGAKMHDDLIDAVDHLVEAGHADRARVAIAGGSYGGYAALVGATFTPEVFACAAEICGPTNLITLLKSFPPYWGPMISHWYERVGNADTEQDFLWSRSPLSRVADITRPLLIIQSENDPRVTKPEADQIVEILKEKGISHEYVVLSGEGHGFVRPESRDIVFGSIERFLAKHLGGRTQD